MLAAELVTLLVLGFEMKNIDWKGHLVKSMVRQCFKNPFDLTVVVKP